jgi:hypothetical protein
VQNALLPLIVLVPEFAATVFLPEVERTVGSQVVTHVYQYIPASYSYLRHFLKLDSFIHPDSFRRSRNCDRMRVAGRIS